MKRINLRNTGICSACAVTLAMEKHLEEEEIVLPDRTIETSDVETKDTFFFMYKKKAKLVFILLYSMLIFQNISHFSTATNVSAGIYQLFQVFRRTCNIYGVTNWK